jgi:sulfite exporter TauE/SafE
MSGRPPGVTPAAPGMIGARICASMALLFPQDDQARQANHFRSVAAHIAAILFIMGTFALITHAIGVHAAEWCTAGREPLWRIVQAVALAPALPS